MKLLIFTQKMDKDDSILGFFHGWVIEMSKKFESVEVVCLYKGALDLPTNVTVYSLGKERGVSKFGYVKNFYKYLSLIRGSYDKVFVHMNQEYVILAGLYWKLKGIPFYMWRNHPAGGIVTRISVALCTKVFCTSTTSFTARFKKTVIMPVGINTNIYKFVEGTMRKKYSVCMIGRIVPIKHPDIAILAVNHLIKSGVQISLTIVGSPLPKDYNYAESLKKQVQELQLSSSVYFKDEVTLAQTPEIYSSHEICLNLTDTGAFDKTIVEAAASGAIPLVSSPSIGRLLPEGCTTTTSPEAIAGSLQRLLDTHQRLEIQSKLEVFVKSQSLEALMGKLVVEMA